MGRKAAASSSTPAVPHVRGVPPPAIHRAFTHMESFCPFLIHAGPLVPEQISFGELDNVRTAIAIARQARTILGGNGVALGYSPMRHAGNLEGVRTYEGYKREGSSAARLQRSASARAAGPGRPGPESAAGWAIKTPGRLASSKYGSRPSSSRAGASRACPDSAPSSQSTGTSPAAAKGLGTLQASFAEGADEGSLGLPAERASARRAGIPGLAAHAGCYLVAPFLAALPFPAPSSGFMASSRLSANFRWEMSSCSVKS